MNHSIGGPSSPAELSLRMAEQERRQPRRRRRRAPADVAGRSSAVRSGAACPEAADAAAGSRRSASAAVISVQASAATPSSPCSRSRRSRSRPAASSTGRASSGSRRPRSRVLARCTTLCRALRSRSTIRSQDFVLLRRRAVAHRHLRLHLGRGASTASTCTCSSGAARWRTSSTCPPSRWLPRTGSPPRPAASPRSTLTLYGHAVPDHHGSPSTNAVDLVRVQPPSTSSTMRLLRLQQLDRSVELLLGQLVRVRDPQVRVVSLEVHRRVGDVDRARCSR